MAYIGTSPSNGVRRKHTYTATASQTSFSGAGAEGATLSYTDSNYVDVYQNGVKLSEADYTSTTGTTVVLATGATVSDMIEIIVYDVFSVADTVSKADGGTFDGNVTMAGTLAVTGIGTFTDDIIIGDGKTIGSTSDVDAMTIASNGQVTFSQTLIGTALDISGDIDVDGTTNLDAVDVDGAVNFAADVTLAAGADLITASAGTNNVRIGDEAGNALASGSFYNILVGDQAGEAITVGDYNIAIGHQALEAMTGGQSNIAIGYQALQTSNVASGQQNNTAVGYLAGTAVTTGVNNTFIGSDAGLTLTDAASNTMVGHGAGQNTNSDKNTFIGRTAGYNVTSGAKNTIVGRFNGNENGLDIRTSSNNIVLSDGDGNPRNRVVANGFTHLSGTTGIGRFGSMLGVSVADNASLSVQGSAASAGGLIISVYDTSSGAGGCFYATFRGGTTLIAEGISGDCSTSVADGKICVSKSSGSHTVTFTNTLGATREFYIGVYGAFVT